MMRHRILALLAGSLVFWIGSAVIAAESDLGWPTYGRDKGGQRHSPLTQITPANVAQLQVAWTYRMRPAIDDSTRRVRFMASQVTPLVVNDRMVLTTPYGRVVALNASSGAEIWNTVIPGPGQPSIRGLEYWPGNAEVGARLFFGTRDGRLIALNAEDGKFVSEFGDAGVVQMATPEVLQGGEGRFYGMTSPPIVFEDLVITGAAVQEFPPRGAAGDVRAWDARSGKLRWTFHSVPRRGERFYNTWAAQV
jgi:quinoprotein glucose dehydrogenase